MRRVFYLTLFLLAGLALSQLLPNLVGTLPGWLDSTRSFLMFALLAYIMIEVGREFTLDFGRLGQYGTDAFVAATAATFPWIFCTIYFLLFLMPDVSELTMPAWKEALIAAFFAAPTSAGVLFSMLAAAGLAGTWTFAKTRNLAIFDDLFVLLLLLPLEALVIGFVWQLGASALITLALLVIGYRFYRRVDLPHSWLWLLIYAAIITAVSEAIHTFTANPATHAAVQVEVLLPAFVLGLLLKPHAVEKPGEHAVIPGEDPPGTSIEERVGLVVSSLFLLFVGLTMPPIFGEAAVLDIDMGVGEIVLHVLALTVVANIGKMAVMFFYRKESTVRERLAVSFAMFPRGEVGAGVLAISLSLGIQGPFVAIAFLSLALNLLMTGLYILVVKRLLADNAHTEHGTMLPSAAGEP